MWGLITVLNFVFSDHLVHIFGVNYSLSTLMNLTFFGAYLIVSIFAGKLIGKVGYKRAILTGWVAATAGCFVFTAAVLLRSYYLFLGALFILAGGITILQVTANLYIVLYGRSDNSASRLNFVQAFNSLGTMLAPFLAGFFLKIMVDVPADVLAEMSTKEKMESLAPYVHYPYLFLGILMAVFAVFLRNSDIPNIKTGNIEPLNRITSLRRRHVMHFPQLRLGAFAIFAYVGAEVALAGYLGTFAEEHNVQIYWALAMVGRFIGAFALVRFSPHRVVGYAAAVSLFLVMFAAMTNGNVSVWSVTLAGLFNSVLFPTIFALGVNGLGKYSEDGSAVLIMFIVGGAIIPFMVKNFSYVDYHFAFLIPVICYFYISLYGFRLSRYEREEAIVEKEPVLET
jgi:FHS family L-fucose permease-like MFS transporter